MHSTEEEKKTKKGEENSLAELFAKLRAEEEDPAKTDVLVKCELHRLAAEEYKKAADLLSKTSNQGSAVIKQEVQG